MKTLGELIRTARLAQNWTQRELADQMNVSRSAVSNWENGKTIPRLSQKKKIVVIRDMGKRSLAKLLAEMKKNEKDRKYSLGRYTDRRRRTLCAERTGNYGY